MNQAEFIGTAIDSVLAQDYPNVELIVADGGSRSDTIKILAERQNRDPRLRWFSRADRGPANAVNNALNMARGTVIGWLNSDDVYAPGAIGRAVAVLGSTSNFLMVYGHGQHVDENGEWLSNYPTLPPATEVQKFAEGCFICQPTMFFRRSAWVLLGSLDEELKTAFDFDYWMRAFTAFQNRIGFVDAVQAFSRLHSACITLRMRRAVALEGMQVLARHLGTAPKEWLLTYLDELMVQNAGAEDLADVWEQAQQAVSIASQWMMPNEKTKMEAAIARRLNGK